jgi:hypothetical protein
MLEEGLAWVAQRATIRGVAVFLLGYAAIMGATLLAAVAVIAALPADYYQEGASGAPKRRGPLSLVLRLAKNLFGAVLVVVGLLLSLPGVPGQGLLTILIGLMLLEFPGKRSLERRLLARPRVLETMNRIRARLGRPPLVR